MQTRQLSKIAFVLAWDTEIERRKNSVIRQLQYIAVGPRLAGGGTNTEHRAHT